LNNPLKYHDKSGLTVTCIEVVCFEHGGGGGKPPPARDPKKVEDCIKRGIGCDDLNLSPWMYDTYLGCFNTGLSGCGEVSFTHLIFLHNLLLHPESQEALDRVVEEIKRANSVSNYFLQFNTHTCVIAGTTAIMSGVVAGNALTAANAGLALQEQTFNILRNVGTRGGLLALAIVVGGVTYGCIAAGA
jgi:hypothetical protein